MTLSIIDVSLMKFTDFIHPCSLGPCLQWVKSCQECIVSIPLILSLSVTLQWHNKSTLCLAAESFKSDIFTSEPVPGVSIFSFSHSLECVLIFLQILFSYHFQISFYCAILFKLSPTIHKISIKQIIMNFISRPKWL